MKKNLLFIMMMFVGFSLSAQIYINDFDAYADGDYLAVVDADNWTTWTDDPGSAEDATISTAYASSAPNAVLVTGTTDAVFPCGDLTSGAYTISFDYLVAGGQAGYFNLQHVFASEWAVEAFLHADGTTRIIAGGNEISDVTYTQDVWFNVQVDINMNEDEATLYFGDDEIMTWQWSLKTDGTAGTNQLGCVNMYAGIDDGSGDNPEYYFDNFVFEEMVDAIYYEDFDGFNNGDYLAVVDPDNWTTWTDDPGSAEDALIVDAQAETAPNSVLVTGLTDAVFPFGDLTSGAYVIAFDYYGEPGKAGYFNLQHIFASEWAIEAYFHADGTTRIIAGGNEVSDVTYTPGTWMAMQFDVDLDNDEAIFYIDETEIMTWQWSLKTDGTAGANQLGCADMYAGIDEGSGDEPQYYFDNFGFFSVSQGLLPPTIEVDITEIDIMMEEATGTETFNIANVGQQDLSYFVYPTYPVSSKLSPVNYVETSNVKLNTTQAMEAPNYTPGEANTTKDAQMHYDGDNTSAIGWTSPGAYKVAAMFPPSEVEEFIGMELTSVDVFINDQPGETQIMIWGRGSTTAPGPGELLATKTFTATIESWNTVELDEAIALDGNPIWIGYSFFQPNEAFVPGTDDGPANPNGDWLSGGPGWSHLSDNPDLNYNWNIRGNLTGNAMLTFIDIPIDMGMIAGESDEDVDVDFDVTYLLNGVYTAQVVIAANDQEANYSTIDVTVDVILSVNDLEAKDAVMLYPNPANDMVFLKANSSINQVRVNNYLGQLVNVQQFNDAEAQINISDLEAGIYFVVVTTDNAEHTIKVVKK